MDEIFARHDDNDDLAHLQRRIEESKPTDYFVHLALTTDDPDMYVEAIETLQLRSTPDVLAAARDLCGSVLPHERKVGAAILSRLGDTAPLLRVARRLRMSGEEWAQAYADKLYARVGLDAADLRVYPKEALAMLLPMLAREEDIEVLREVICAAAEYQEFHPEVTERIAALRTHPNRDIRFTVATRLALNLDSPAARHALHDLSGDTDIAVRRVAAEWLALIRS